MKNRSTIIAATIAGATACAIGAHGQVVIDTVTVGNPGNVADPLNSADIPGIGRVDYEYRMARHEVTNDEYAEFLSAVATTDTNDLYNTEMDTDPHGGITRSGSPGRFSYSVKANMGNKPVIYVSFLDAMRFVNWLQNGQPTGEQNENTTEDGVYAISDGASEARAAGAQYFIPTENEWYKAAYHQPSGQGGDADDYWLYPTASNSTPALATAGATGDISNPGANVANYSFGADWNGQDGNVTTVGSAGPLSESFYGTSDQGGNAFEWNEAVAFDQYRGLRGGAWDFEEHSMQSSGVFSTYPAFESASVGFRVAAIATGEGDCIRSPQWLCDGDVDGDGQVNPVDSGLVQASFGSTDETDLCQYDLDCDGQINPVDSGIVQSLFGTCEVPREVCP